MQQAGQLKSAHIHEIIYGARQLKGATGILRNTQNARTMTSTDFTKTGEYRKVCFSLFRLNIFQVNAMAE